MSVDATKILFEGFLQKRKDTLKIRWVTYWFRLQNTTLFFYTKENGSASHLKGYYYIYTVQSVREVHRSGGKRFMFEITMTNGKRKMLAAQTAALRKEWVEHLWQAMHLSTSTVSESKDTDFEEYEQQEDISNSSEPICSNSESVMESLPVRPLSAPAPPSQIHCETRSKDSPWVAESSGAGQEPDSELDSEEATYQNISLLACNLHHQNVDSPNDPQWSSELSNAETQPGGDYDVLPARKQVCDASVSMEMDEDVYDIPLSYRFAEQDPEESIYDVPSSVMLNVPDDTTEEQHEEELYWKI